MSCTPERKFAVSDTLPHVGVGICVLGCHHSFGSSQSCDGGAQSFIRLDIA